MNGRTYIAKIVASCVAVVSWSALALWLSMNVAGQYTIRNDTYQPYSRGLGLLDIPTFIVGLILLIGVVFLVVAIWSYEGE